MGFKDRLDRLKSTRLGKTSKYEKREHEEMAEKYEKKKKFHEATKKPKSESLRDKLVKKALAKGKELQEKSKQHAIDELKKSKSKKSKKSKTKSKIKPESNTTSTSNTSFDFGFGNQNNEQFGFGMFTPEPTTAAPKQQDVDWSRVYNFRMNTDSHKKKKANSFENVWDSRGFWK